MALIFGGRNYTGYVSRDVYRVCSLESRNRAWSVGLGG